MDGYTLTEKMRKARRRFRFTAAEQALFYELVAICNDEDWRDVFEASNIELCAALNINEKTLIKARESLINAKMIYYRSGKSRRVIGSYSFTKEFKTAVRTTVKNTGDNTGGSTVDKGVDRGVDATVDSTDYIYKTKTETKLKENTPLSPKGGCELDFVLDEFRDVFFLWLDYKKERREKYKSAKSLKACYNELVKLSGNSPAIAHEIVNQSMANNWAGLFPLKNKSNGNENTATADNSGNVIIRTTNL